MHESDVQCHFGSRRACSTWLVRLRELFDQLFSGIALYEAAGNHALITAGHGKTQNSNALIVQHCNCNPMQAQMKARILLKVARDHSRF